MMGRHLERDVLALGYLVLNGRLGFAAQLAGVILREHVLSDEEHELLSRAHMHLLRGEPNEAEAHIKRLALSGMPRRPRPAPAP